MQSWQTSRGMLAIDAKSTSSSSFALKGVLNFWRDGGEHRQRGRCTVASMDETRSKYLDANIDTAQQVSLIPSTEVIELA